MTMAYPLATEKRLIAKVLEEEAADAEDMAGRVIVALDKERASKTRYAIIEQVPLEGDLVSFHVTGPYSTQKQAETALRIGNFLRIGLDGQPAHYRWAYMRHPMAFKLALEKADEVPPAKREVKRGRGRRK